MNQVIAGIISYNPNIERLLLEINSVRSQVKLMCTCDNGSNNINDIEDKINYDDKIVLIKNGENLGIGKAANIICQYAFEEGFSWVLMLDHDTICSYNMISVYMQYTNQPEIGMICPNIVDKEIAYKKWISQDYEGTDFVRLCIQ